MAIRTSALAAAVVVVSLALFGLSAGNASSQSPPPACPSPPAPAAAASARVRVPASELVVCIGAMAIDGATFDHWAFVAERSAGRHHRLTRHAVVTQVLNFLISSYWTIGEATAQGVTVTEAQVRQRFDRLRRQSFPKHGEFARFLHSSGQTVADLLLRVRLNMVSAALQRKIVAGKRTNKERAAALAGFIRTFKARWKAQTYCATGYADADCGHVGAL